MSAGEMLGDVTGDMRFRKPLRTWALTEQNQTTTPSDTHISETAKYSTLYPMYL